MRAAIKMIPCIINAYEKTLTEVQMYKIKTFTGRTCTIADSTFNRNELTIALLNEENIICNNEKIHKFKF